MNKKGVLILTRSEIARLMQFSDYVDAVETAFRLYTEGRIQGPGILDVPGLGGMFHIKAAGMSAGDSNYVAIKVNGNFPENKSRFGLPTIQGAIVLCDGIHGNPLAIMDSTEITTARTAAATAAAAKHLARTDSHVATICGCGNQGRIQLQALKTVLPIEGAFAFDREPAATTSFCSEMAEKLRIRVDPVTELSEALHASDVIVTCTTSHRFFVRKEDVRPGAFVAAVGADSHDKQELDPMLLSTNKVVADILAQCVRIGELHHAVELGLMRPADVHAELGEVICGRKPGRVLQDEIIVFDSTGAAIQDVASAVVVYDRALKAGVGMVSEIME